MWKKILAMAHAIGFTSNETTVILFLTGAILAGAGLHVFRGGLPRDLPEYAEAYRVHDSLFAARSSALFDEPRAASDTVASEPAESGAPAAAPTAHAVNINTASPSELESLPGVGPATAARIIEYRATAGRFTAVEDIMNVPGIGPKKFERMKAFLSIE